MAKLGQAVAETGLRTMQKTAEAMLRNRIPW